MKVESRYVDTCKPFKVRTSCGHIVIRKMREATAGVPWSEGVVIEAPGGRPCDACRVPTLNARVRVRIANPTEYSGDAAVRMNGAIGKVVAVKPDYAFTGEDGYLVEFDKPLEGWWTHQSEVKSFHFPKKDLEVLS